ncbi:MAG: permease [Rhodospirillales bacterium]|nr:permease [Rhodospirillales bacterium]
MDSDTPGYVPTKEISLKSGVVSFLGNIDPVVGAMAGLFAFLLLLAPGQVPESLKFTGLSLLQISPFLIFSVAVAAAAKATGSEKLIAKVFSGNPARMIVFAAAFGTLSPFCSCGVIPLIAGLLSAGVPLAPVMAFWISSPLMDPEIFILSAATLGLHFTVGKTLAAFGLGLFGGFATLAAQRAGLFENPLTDGISKCCSSSCSTDKEQTVLWPFWREAGRRSQFNTTLLETGWFLGKWLTLAFVIESLMVAYIPASMIAEYLGGGAWWTIPAAVLVGVPAYMNGFAAIPLMEGLINLGMAKGAAMAFMVGGGVTSIPAAIAVFAMVRRQVFFYYVGLALVGSTAAGFLYQLSLST